MVTIGDVHAAAARIRPHVKETALVPSPAIALVADQKSILFKMECAQVTGSFKIRGVTNAVFCERERHPEVTSFVCQTSGNHGIGLSVACRNAVVAAHVIVPENAPDSKVQKIIRKGGILYRSVSIMQRRLSMMDVLARQLNAIPIHPSNNCDVIAGQGTVALEMLQRAPELEAIVVPVGGGGILAGTALVAKTLKPSIKVFAAEPAGADDCYRSLKAGKILPHRDGLPNTMADGLLATLGSLTFPIIQQFVDGVILVSEQEISHALRVTLNTLKVVVETNSAVAVAAAMSPAMPKGLNVGIILTGGNLDLDELPAYLKLSKL